MTQPSFSLLFIDPFFSLVPLSLAFSCLSQSVNQQTNQPAGKWCCILIAGTVVLTAVMVAGIVVVVVAK